MVLLLVINADDFGLHPVVDESILSCHRDGVVTSTSLLVNHILVPVQPRASNSEGEEDVKGISYKQRAVERAMAAGLPIGIHFNLTEGHPVSSTATQYRIIAKSSFSEQSEPADTLHHSQSFLGKFGFRSAVEEAIKDEKRREILKCEIATELRAQYERFLQITGGIPPTHADGHQHFHVEEGVPQIVAETLRELGIRWIRIPKEDSFLQLNDDANLSVRDKFHRLVSQQAKNCETIYRNEGLQTTDAFLGLQLMDAPQGSKGFLSAVKNVLSHIDAPSPSSTFSMSCEVMTHPGYVDPQLLKSCSLGGFDVINSTLSFCTVEGRKNERDTMTDQALVQVLKNHSRISLRSFKDISPQQ